MPTLKQLLDPEQREEVYALKDTLKNEQILAQDPMHLNRTKFEAYLAAKAESVLTESLVGGDSAVVAYAKARQTLRDLDADWRMVAKALNLSKAQ